MNVYKNQIRSECVEATDCYKHYYPQPDYPGPAAVIKQDGPIIPRERFILVGIIGD